MAAFSLSNRSARSLYAGGDSAGAWGQYRQAQAISARLSADGGGVYGSDDLDFTLSVLQGDQGAGQAAAAGGDLISRTQGNQGTGIDYGRDRGTFTGDVLDSGKGLFAGLVNLPWKWIGLGGAALVGAVLWAKR